MPAPRLNHDAPEGKSSYPEMHISVLKEKHARAKVLHQD